MSKFYVDDKVPHLGGFCVGGDDATYYPELWEWLIAEHKVRHMIDVGCGEGHACGFFASLGCEAVGVDGVNMTETWMHDASFITHDFSKGRLGLSTMGYEADLVWSCEFVEHVEERFLPNFLETFAVGRLVLMTHADPGQQGYHHVNCQPESYWRGAMAAIGYSIDEDFTQRARALAAFNRNPWNHFARSGLAFVRV